MTSLRQIVRVMAGHRVEIVAPQLEEGELVEVIVLPRSVLARAGKSTVAFLDSLPEGPRAFPTWDSYERHLRDEKESWDR